jgi:hypothetical protein
MLTGYNAFKVYKGDTFVFSMQLKTGANNFPVTGYTFSGQVKEKGKSTTIASFNFTITNASTGTVQVTLSATESAKLTGGKLYEYDIQMSNSGVISTLFKGPLTVVADVTQ